MHKPALCANDHRRFECPGSARKEAIFILWPTTAGNEEIRGTAIRVIEIGEIAVIAISLSCRTGVSYAKRDRARRIGHRLYHPRWLLSASRKIRERRPKIRQGAGRVERVSAARRETSDNGRACLRRHARLCDCIPRDTTISQDRCLPVCVHDIVAGSPRKRFHGYGTVAHVTDTSRAAFHRRLLQPIPRQRWSPGRRFTLPLCT